MSVSDKTNVKKTRRLRGKYQITKNIFVTCYLDVLEASNECIKTFIGLKKRGDTLMPIGTKIFFDGETLNKKTAGDNQTFEILSITVQQIEDFNGQQLHICSPINKETRSNKRKATRKVSDFPIILEGKKSTSEFLAKGGTSRGLTLQCTSKRTMLSLALGQTYDFGVDYKEKHYRLSGEIKHIQYDWKTYEHIIGVYFPTLAEDLATVLNLLIDPEYTIEISEKQTIDSALGKISSSLDD